MNKKRLAGVLITLFIIFLQTPALAIESSNKGKVSLLQNGSYHSFVSSNQIREVAKAKTKAVEELPNRYDLRDIGGISYVKPPEFQEPWGCCWAFGALSAAESNTLIKGGPQSVNFSKRAFSWYAFQKQGNKEENSDLYEGMWLTSEDPSLESILPFCSGGNTATVISQMASWNGASTSTEIPYQNDEGKVGGYFDGYAFYSPYGTWSLPYDDIYDNAYHLIEANRIPTEQDYRTENIEEYTAQAKELLLNEGALLLEFSIQNGTDNFNADTFSQYTPTKTVPDHAASIVGWDDDYAVSNFNPLNQPPAPGAWIVKNNWSKGWGDEGYFYLSYYDESIYGFGSFDVETPALGYSYDHNNEYDFMANKDYLSSAVEGSLMSNLVSNDVDPENVKAANIFTPNSYQLLQAVSAYTNYSGAKVNIEIYKLNQNYSNPEDGVLIISQQEQIDFRGFHTIELETPFRMEPNESYAVIENIIYPELEINNKLYENVPGIPVEFGASKPYAYDFFPYSEADVQTGYQNFSVTVEPGTSYICGINTGDRRWLDLSGNEAQSILSVSLENWFEIDDGNKSIPGNAMIKIFTSDSQAPEPNESISVNNGIKNIYLSTMEEARNSIDLKAVLNPADPESVITWMISTDNVATLSNVTGSTTTLTAVEEGRATLTVNSEIATTVINIIVDNDPIVASNIEITTNSPDYFNVIVHNVQANPAFGKRDSVKNVSIFCWSEKNQEGIQTDMNAKAAEKVVGTNDWQFVGFPVNDTPVNNYFIAADDIQINVYASLESGSNETMLGAGTYSWVNSVSAGNNLLGYIGYSQNLGFDKPTVYADGIAGTTGQALNLEGLRISSNIEGCDINTRVHVQNIGWLDTVSDGTYAGTMHRNLGLEAVELSLSGVNAANYTLEYRVHQNNLGWGDWVEDNQIAGSTGQNIQLEAIQVRLIQMN